MPDFGTYTSSATRVRTWLGTVERTFTFPYTALSQEEAWLLDMLGYVTGPTPPPPPPSILASGFGSRQFGDAPFG